MLAAVPFGGLGSVDGLTPFAAPIVLYPGTECKRFLDKRNRMCYTLGHLCSGGVSARGAVVPAAVRVDRAGSHEEGSERCALA
jgi:hypothetical protein